MHIEQIGSILKEKNQSLIIKHNWIQHVLRDIPYQLTLRKFDMTRREKKALEEARIEEKRRCNAAKTTLRVLGIGLLAGAVIAVATKKVFDDIFVGEDRSDVDWGEDEDEDEDYSID